MSTDASTELLSVLYQRALADRVIREGGRDITAGELLTRLDQVRGFLAEAGLRNVALLAENSADWIIVDLACQAEGCCLVPLPAFFSDSQLRASLHAAGIEAIITDDPRRAQQLAQSQLQWFAMPGCEKLAAASVGEFDDPLMPADTAKVTFTSGSTGEPKGVCLSTEQQLRVAQSINRATGLAEPHHLCLLPLSTLLENVGGLYSTLLAGGEVTVLDSEQAVFSGSGGLNTPLLTRALDLHRPGSIILLPQMLLGLVVLLRSGWQPPQELRFVAVGGARVAAELISEARRFGLPVYEGYGLSEVASVACLNVPGRDKPGSVGTPLEHIELGCDGGEIILRGNVFLGYLGQPESWHAEYFATGDLGGIDADGFCHVVGRKKNLLITGFGRNVSPEWPESEVLGDSGISHCVLFGDDRPYCSALIQGSANYDESYIQSVLDRVNRKLPDYARIKAWRHMPAELVRDNRYYTANGRPRRGAIARDYSALIDSMYVQPSGYASAKEASLELF